MKFCQGTAVDVISDDEGSWMSESESPSTTVSDVENEGLLLLIELLLLLLNTLFMTAYFVISGYLEPPISDNCYATYGDVVRIFFMTHSRIIHW